MEAWALRGMQRWPNVPALYGWLSLDRRGRWRIRGETISRPQIIDTLNANYEADARGCWYFQNGPQRGYVALERAPLVLWTQADGRLQTHTGRVVAKPSSGYLDEDGGLWLATEHGPGALADRDLAWLLTRIEGGDGGPIDEDRLASALAVPAGAATALLLRLGGVRMPLVRISAAQAGAVLGFDPTPAAPTL